MSHDPLEQMFEAASFAARAHRHQTRKDGRTPYAAHPFRVCLVVRQVFGIDDPKVLTAALLHDTIEDTPTDFDDIAEQFGADVAKWVGDLTKDMRIQEHEREAEYHRILAEADWPVYVCKLADIYDNLSDGRHLNTKSKQRRIRRSVAYMEALRPNLPAEAKRAFEITEKKLAEISASESDEK